MTLDQKLTLAKDLHAKGYNCAQSVLLANAEDLRISENTAAAYSMGFGGGVGGQGEICGVVSALAMAVGIADGATPADKPAAYRTVRELTQKFRENNGCIRCMDLKAPPQKIPCDDLIADGVRILHNHICEKK